MSNTNFIDLNCDLGEGVGNESGLMPLITSCSIACGGHAGSHATVAQVIALAKEYEVKVGAHPSFPDRKNFGRQFIPMPITLLRESLIQQINLVARECERQEINLHHIKPHGALYNRCAVDRAYGEMIIGLMEESFKEVKLYAPYKSIIAKMAKNRVGVTYEVFADRNYNADHTLVSRTEPNALITDPKKLAEHILFMVQHQKIRSINNIEIPTKAETLCLHGDTPGAVALVHYINKTLTEAGLIKPKQ